MNKQINKNAEKIRDERNKINMYLDNNEINEYTIYNPFDDSPYFSKKEVDKEIKETYHEIEILEMQLRDTEDDNEIANINEDIEFYENAIESYENAISKFEKLDDLLLKLSAEIRELEAVEEKTK
jgi:Uma2 family endonuclease